MTGRVNELSSALLTTGRQAFELLLAFGGMLCVWNGVMNVAKNSGITAFFSKMLKPVIGLLFPKYKKNQEICEDISMNMTANLLGLGNAATPAGLRAITGNGVNVLSMGAFYVAPQMGIEIAEAYLNNELGSGYEWWHNFYEFHKLAFDEMDSFNYEEYKANGFKLKHLGDYPLALEEKPDE
jgi:hypothetical protein